MARAANAMQPPIPLETVLWTRLQELAAVLTPEQRQWASGYLLGAAGAVAPQTTPANDAILTVLYGSQTGTGRRIAERLASLAEAGGLPVRLASMADYPVSQLRRERFLALVLSTHGEGDPPDDAELLWEHLTSDRAPKLTSLRYGVLALGDSSYEHFCQTGRDFDERLAALGGKAFVARIECDLDFEQPASAWRDRILEAVAPLLGDSAEGSTPVLRAVPTAPKFDRDRPYPARLVANQKITARTSDKDVRHVELDLGDSALQYQPGDALGIWPRNPDSLVRAALSTGLDKDAEVCIGEQAVSVEQALTQHLELTTLSRSFVERYAALTGSKRLTALLAPEARSSFVEAAATTQVVDLLRDIPYAGEAQSLLACLRPLAPRLYSIASSPEAHPDEAHLTVRVVNYQAYGWAHTGAASGFLAGAELDANIPAYIEPNPRFRLPANPATDLIMVGPGTGVAPFRAFMQHRELAGASGRNWLFFGERRRDSDFLYQLDWLRWLKSGLLTQLDVAFSRDQAERIYVQRRLREHAAEVYAWLQDGAAIYICGDAERMAEDVNRTLLDIIREQSGGEQAQAEAYLRELKRDGRYQRDVY